MNKTILIIDDDDILRKTLAHALRADGFNVLTAQSAEDGADVLSRIFVDAIILDRMMTGTDGLTFLQTLRKSGNHVKPVKPSKMVNTHVIIHRKRFSKPIRPPFIAIFFHFIPII